MRQPQGIVSLKKKSMTRLEPVFPKSKKLSTPLSGSPRWLKLQLTSPSRLQRRPLRTFRLLRTTKCHQPWRLSWVLTCRQLNPPRSRSLHWVFVTPDLVRKSSQRLVLRQAITRPRLNCLEGFVLTLPKSLKVRGSIMFIVTLHFIEINESDIKRAQLGLGHSYSRHRCAQDVNRQDKPII